MRSMRIAGIALFSIAVLAAPLVATGGAVAAPAAHAGASGAGDPYFPRQGNGGYDVAHYGIRIAYRPATKMLRGVTTVTARATEALTRFDLDLRRNMRVSSVTVDGHPASFGQPRNQVQELVITPAALLTAGHRFTVVVRYAGTVSAVIDPDGSLDGFIPTDDGAFVASEPQGSPSWFPANDTPRDKATVAVAITVPTGLTALSNGHLTGVSHAAATTTWSWRLDQAVSTYLMTATLGKFDLSFGTTPGGVPYAIAVDPTQKARANPVLAQLPAIVDYFTSVYGAYPFGDAGAIVDNAPQVGYALETATRPVFDRAPDVATLSHELAHQWYGDDVTLSKWRDIWINEGFAEFSSWLYDEHIGGKSAAQHLADIMARPASDDGTWNPPPGNPGAADAIFSGSVYDRGAATLETLRQMLGDGVFFTIMRGWVAAHAYGNASVGEFTKYAQAVSHRHLARFFDDWLFQPGKPTV